MQLISLFKKMEYEITFVSNASMSDNAEDLKELGIITSSIELNNSSFDTYIKSIQPDLVLFDRFITEEQYGWRVSEHCPEAIKILDTEDLHFLRRARQTSLKSNEVESPNNLFNDTAKRELASIYRCDLSLIISDYEMRLLTDTFGVNASLLFYLPFLFDDLNDSIISKHQHFDERFHFMTIGNFLHEPNYDALKYLKTSLWPQIKKKLPNAELHNYGAYPSQKVQQLHNENEGFFIKGFVHNVDEVMQSSKVLLAPLRFGAGLKGKLFDAMRNGLPFVSTTVGIEGIIDDSQQNCGCDDPNDFIDEAVTLYTNRSHWQSRQKLGYNILRTKFPKDRYELSFSERLKKLKKDYKAERQQNYIGQLLQFHSFQSTKYMSKWIALKNQQSSK